MQKLELLPVEFLKYQFATSYIRGTELLASVIWGLVRGVERDAKFTRFAVDRVFSATQFQTNDSCWRVALGELLELFLICTIPVLACVACAFHVT